MIGTEFYRQYFTYNQNGVGSAIAVVLFITVIPVMVYTCGNSPAGRAVMKSKFFSSLLINGSLAIICLLWTIPTLGLLISSFRDRIDISNSGWWAVFPHQEWISVEKITPAPTVDRYSPMTLEGLQPPSNNLTQGINQDGNKSTSGWQSSYRLSGCRAISMDSRHNLYLREL